MLEFTSLHKKKITESNELFTEIVVIGSIIALIGLLILGIKESIKEAKRQEEYKRRIKKILEFVRKYYPSICNKVNRQKNKDPFYFKDKSNLYDVTNVIQSLNNGIIFLKQACKYRSSYRVRDIIEDEKSTEYDIKSAIDEDLNRFLSGRFNTPEEESLTLSKAGWLNAQNVLHMLDSFDRFTDCYFWFFDHLHSELRLKDKYLENNIDRYIINHCLSNTGIFELFRAYGGIFETLRNILIHAKKFQENE